MRTRLQNEQKKVQTRRQHTDEVGCSDRHLVEVDLSSEISQSGVKESFWVGHDELRRERQLARGFHEHVEDMAKRGTLSLIEAL